MRDNKKRKIKKNVKKRVILSWIIYFLIISLVGVLLLFLFNKNFPNYYNESGFIKTKTRIVAVEYLKSPKSFGKGEHYDCLIFFTNNICCRINSDLSKNHLETSLFENPNKDRELIVTYNVNDKYYYSDSTLAYQLIAVDDGERSYFTLQELLQYNQEARKEYWVLYIILVLIFALLGPALKTFMLFYEYKILYE